MAVLANQLRNDRNAIQAVERFFARFPKLSRDANTVERVGGYFRVTRGLLTDEGKLRTFKENRYVSGELKALVQLLHSERVLKIWVLKPILVKGAVNADFLIQVKGIGDQLKVEVTTVTGAAARARTKPRTPGTGGKDPWVDRPTTTDTVVAAVGRKLNSGQGEGGIVVIEVPYGTSKLLTPQVRAKIQQMWKDHRAKGGGVREVWIVLPDLAQPRFIAGQGLGLVDRLR